MASSNSLIDKSQCSIRAELPDVNINMGVQCINRAFNVTYFMLRTPPQPIKTNLNKMLQNTAWHNQGVCVLYINPTKMSQFVCIY